LHFFQDGGIYALFGGMWSTKQAWFVRGLTLAVLAALVYVIPFHAGAVETEAVPGHVPAALARLRPIEPLAPSTQLHLAVGLPLRNPMALKNLLEQICNPASPNYRHYLTPEQFTERFGPTQQEYQDVIDFVRARGLTVGGVHPNRMVLEVSGSAAAVEKALSVNLRVYAHPSEDRKFYAPDSEPQVQKGLHVLHISGLDNFVLPRPAGLRPTPWAPGGAPVPAFGSGPGGNYGGNDFRAAYAPGVPLTGAGESVALVEFVGYYASDVVLYEKDFHLPEVTLTNILLDGVSSVTNGAGSTNGAEPSLDIEMSVSMAPGLSSVMIYYGENGDSVLSRIASDNAARQVSASWTFFADSTTTQIFQEMAAQGQSYVNASGDSDAYTRGIPSPVDNPYVTVVGGTTLSMKGAGAGWLSETTWNRGGGTGSSGGVSRTYPIPLWQQGIDMSASLGSTTMRNLPDVAMVAENVWLISQNGVAEPVGGTSVSAPLWAAFTALMNQQAAANDKPPVGFLNPAVYLVGKGAGYTAAFHDITTGNNIGTNTAPKYPAVAGYDLCTGWGSPAGSNLINALIAPVDFLEVSPASGFTAVTPYGRPFSPTNITFTLTNASAGAVNWRLGNTSLWLKASSSAGVLTTDAPVANVTIDLDTASTSNLSAGTYYVNLWFTNQSTTLVQGRLFTVIVSSADWPLEVSGFNAGVIVPANATIANPQATAFDLVNDYCFYQAGLSGGSAGLPGNGAFVSQADNTTVFQFGPGGGANALLTGYAYPGSGTLTLLNPQSYNSLTVLAASANGSAEGALVLNFADGATSQPFSLNVQDWLNATTNAAIQGFGRLKLSDFLFDDPGPANPTLCQTTLDLAGLGLNQPIASITFSNLSRNPTQDCGIFALSGAVMPPQTLIVRQPLSVTNSVPSEAAVFSVVAMGAPVLGYQWFFSAGGVTGSFAPLAGQTSPGVTLDLPQPANAGSYYVVVTNSYNAATSLTATLSLFRAPVIIQQPEPASATLFGGQSFSLSAAANAAQPVYYSWTQDGMPIPAGTNSVFAFNDLKVADSGDYSLIVSNAFGAVTSSVVSLTVIPAPNYPYARAVLADQPLGYWRLDERSGTVAHDYMAGNNGIYSHTTLGQPGYNLLDSQTVARFGTPSSANSYAGGIAADFATAGSAAFSIEAWVNGKAQSSDCGLVAKGARGSEQFSLDCGGANYAFRFLVRDASGLAHAASGTLVPDGQWRHLVGVCDQANRAVLLYVDGMQAAQAAITPASGILGSTNSLSIGSRQSGTTTYDLQFVGFMEEVAIYDYPLSATQVQAHYSVVTNPPTPLIPAIATPPLTQTAEVGSPVGFWVEVTNAAPGTTYQWYFNATDALGGATNSNLDLANAQPIQAGAYTVVVTNLYGAVTSAPALLSLIAPVQRRVVPALNLTAGVGALLQLDYVDDFGSGTQWLSLSNVTVESTPQLCFDLSEPLPAQRFYRASQTNVPSARPVLDMRLATEIPLTGTIGSSVQIDYINQFGPTSAWVTLDTVVLTNTAQLYFDVTMFRQPTRLYRLVPLP
jgi:hypothetical protein